MSNSPFTRFINLVAFDKKIQSCLYKKELLEKKLTSVDKKRKELESAILQLQQNIVQLKKEVDAQELEMKTLDEKEREKKRCFETLSDYKESKALKTEIDAIHRLQDAQESIILDAWARLESAQTMLEKKKVEYAAQSKMYDDETHALGQEQELIITELNNLRVGRVEQLVDLPQEWIEKYELMGQRVENPVVEIEHDSCSGCYQQIPTPDLMRARRGALLQCRKCFRLLYLSEAVGYSESL